MLDDFRHLLGENAVLSEAEETEPFLKEWRGLYQGKALAVLRPGSTSEVSDAVRMAAKHGLKIIPQGGNTGLVGGQIPNDTKRHVILSTERLNGIREVNSDGNFMTVEAGVVLENIQKAADEIDRFFPLALGSQGTCQIGGNISTNAGGTGVLAYGNTRDLILGLEVVLADGSVWNGLRALRKNNTGYDLKQLFIGAEGTLGIVTAAVVKLFPKPRGRQVAFMAFDSPHAALATLNIGQGLASGNLTGFELMPRIGLDYTTTHLDDARDPIADQYPWYALVEISSGRAEQEAEALMTELFEQAFEAGYVLDAALAQSSKQQDDFWRLRHGMSAVQKFEGGSIKHDVSVPVSAMPDFIMEASKAVQSALPGCRPVPFGHLGDGNIHFNVSQPIGADKDDFLAQWDRINDIVHDIVLRYDGSVSAEHGIGRLKAKLMPSIKSDIELNMMRQIKASMDPTGLFNPGALIPD
ncbi:MAG: FAD-binding oxidoreductase [Hyphomicrobiales bacterium]